MLFILLFAGAKTMSRQINRNMQTENAKRDDRSILFALVGRQPSSINGTEFSANQDPIR